MPRKHSKNKCAINVESTHCLSSVLGFACVCVRFVLFPIYLFCVFPKYSLLSTCHFLRRKVTSRTCYVCCPTRSPVWSKADYKRTQRHPGGIADGTEGGIELGQLFRSPVASLLHTSIPYFPLFVPSSYCRLQIRATLAILSLLCLSCSGPSRRLLLAMIFRTQTWLS